MSTTGSGLGAAGCAGPQYTGTTKRDEGLVGSGVDTTGSGRGLIGSDTRDSGLAGQGAGSGLTGNQSGYDSGRIGDSTGSGLTGDNSGYGSGTTAGSGLTGSSTSTTGPHSSNLENKMDPRVDSDRDGSRNMGASGTTGSGGYGSSTTGSGLTGSSATGTDTTGGYGSSTTGGASGLAGKAEQYIEGSEKHHRGDGHPEDIVHPGPHVTGTAKALDPHLN